MPIVKNRPHEFAIRKTHIGNNDLNVRQWWFVEIELLKDVKFQQITKSSKNMIKVAKIGEGNDDFKSHLCWWLFKNERSEQIREIKDLWPDSLQLSTNRQNSKHEGHFRKLDD